MVDFLLALVERFSLSTTVPELWGEMCTARLFSRGIDLFALKFYLDRVLPSTIIGIRKLEALGYPTVKIAFLCANSFWHNNGVWRTDRQKDGRADLPCSTYSAVKTTTQSRCAIFKNKTFIHHVSRIQHCRKDKRYGFAGSVLILSELLYPAVWRTIIACRFAQIIVYLICLKKTINCYRCLSYRPTSITV